MMNIRFYNNLLLIIRTWENENKSCHSCEIIIQEIQNNICNDEKFNQYLKNKKFSAALKHLDKNKIKILEN